MNSNDNKLKDFFQQLENIKQTYSDLSSSCLHKGSKMSWTEFEKEYKTIGEVINPDKFKDIQSELIEEVMYSILEMLDGYSDLDFELDVVDKQTGESIKNGIQLHDKYRDFVDKNK
ncbi:hypothetical protein MH215_09600 [Paenibacillus sp. ACRSA]|uniref:hypothetical protein n=1 Tax=Paenibacillus sp. ACRSA TaxID=2918211 RepID=UPI001EF5AD2F|nr:hypothetical protein [Paenibacillus sp. ACRSA]MCG7377248.1 hypothetical protein [Paenibacillus sp. ACRSA]